MNPVHRFLVNIFKCQVRTNFKFLILVYKLLLYPAHSYFSSPTSHHSPPCTLSRQPALAFQFFNQASLSHFLIPSSPKIPVHLPNSYLSFMSQFRPCNLCTPLASWISFITAALFMIFLPERDICLVCSLSLFVCFFVVVVCLFVCFSFYGLARGMWKFPGPGIKSMPVLFALIPFRASTTPGKE